MRLSRGARVHPRPLDLQTVGAASEHFPHEILGLAIDGEKHAAEIGGRFQSVNVADDEAVAAAVAEAEGAHGTARILVNCAGIGTPARVLDKEGNPLRLDAFRKVIDVNLIGSFNVLSKFAARAALGFDIPAIAGARPQRRDDLTGAVAG